MYVLGHTNVSIGGKATCTLSHVPKTLNWKSRKKLWFGQTHIVRYRRTVPILSCRTRLAHSVCQLYMYMLVYNYMYMYNHVIPGGLDVLLVLGHH